MKTSNKLLLIFSLSVLAVFLGIHLTLYSQLRHGHIFNSRMTQDGWTRSYDGAAPAILVMEGNINVTLIPSDSFYLEVQEEFAGKVHCRLAGDSLVVKGDGTFVANPHGFHGNYSDLPWVSVHMGHPALIRLRDVLALLRGYDKPGSFDTHITVTNAQLWIGESYGANGADYPSQYYDSLQVEGENADLVLHSNAHINHLAATLDARSEVNEQRAKLGTISIQYTPQTKINLTGLNLDKLNKGAQ
jgi:hypothetical protein